MTFQPEGFQPDGYQPDGMQPEYVTPTHSAVGLSATVRSIGRRIVSSSFRLIAGNSVKLEFTVVDEGGNAVDISPDVIRFVLSKGQETVITSDDVATITRPQASAGTFVVSIADESTQELLGTYLFQAEVEDTVGDRATVARGYITFSENLFLAAS